MLKPLGKSISFLDCLNLEKKYSCKIIVVSKKQKIETMEKAYAQGFRHFGESYVQEALLKQKVLKTTCPDIIWHFVGSIQSNKLKLIVPNFSYLHSVDSLSLVHKIITHTKKNTIPSKHLNIFLQINVSNDPKKSGFLLKKFSDDLKQNNLNQDKLKLGNLKQEDNPLLSEDFNKSVELIKNTTQIYLQGFMTMPFLYSDLTKTEQDFQRLKLLSVKYSKQVSYQLETSMGTSQDYKLALNAGAHWIRLGEIILGKRV